MLMTVLMFLLGLALGAAQPVTVRQRSRYLKGALKWKITKWINFSKAHCLAVPP
jgi:hypothetical protein